MGRAPPPPPRAPRDSLGSVAGLGLEPAVQATLFAFSHLLRHAASRDSLRSGASGSPPNTPPAAPPLISIPRASFRFSSLRHSNKRRSKSHANIAKAAVPTPVVPAPPINPEQEIIAFQKQLQNLPDFDSPEHPTAPGGSAGATGIDVSEVAPARPYLRPRSRSMPRVSYESSRYLTLPEAWHSGNSNSSRLHRGRSAGALNPASHSPISTPGEDKSTSGSNASSQAAAAAAAATATATAVSATAAANSGLPNSRRSSLSPSDRAGRRRDSPACLIEVPPWHRAILNFIEVILF